MNPDEMVSAITQILGEKHKKLIEEVFLPPRDGIEDKSLEDYFCLSEQSTGMEEKIKAFEKALDLCATPDDCQKALDRSEHNPALKELAWKKMVSVLEKQLSLADNLEDCFELCVNLRGEAKVLVLAKAMEFASDSEKCWRIYSATLDKNIRRKAVEKILETATYDECEIVYTHVSDDDLQIRTIERAVHLAKTAEQCLPWIKRLNQPYIPDDLKSTALKEAISLAAGISDLKVIFNIANRVYPPEAKTCIKAIAALLEAKCA